MLLDEVIDENNDIIKQKNKKLKDKEVWSILKIVFGVFSLILIALYYVGIYFSFYDEDSEYEKKRK